MMTGFEQYTKKTRRALFLEEMEQVVPWRELCALVEPHYPKPGNGRPPVGVERMLRIYFLQQWFNLSDPAVEEALYDSAVMRQFVGIDLGLRAGAGRDHGVQVPAPAGRTPTGRTDPGAGEPALASERGADHDRHDRGRDHHSRAHLRPRTASSSATRRCTRRRRASNGVCHEHERKLVMLYRRWETGLPESACRSRLQTARCCCVQKAWW